MVPIFQMLICHYDAAKSIKRTIVIIKVTHNREQTPVLGAKQKTLHKLGILHFYFTPGRKVAAAS
ncbi:MAG: hypothetical protein B1H11_09640 [Desulfobacteraceae bacterium 4484_190.1]|nr:MAG: hypothetical protein B1H11_09640 [Desulfobacteraceae bacterium 4484_190.1]